MSGPLGGQTVVLHPHRRVKATDYAPDPNRPVSEHPGWSVQPMTPEEQSRAGLAVTERWKGYGPAPFPAQARDRVTFTPGGPTSPDGEPALVDVDGGVATWPDEHGEPHHVEVMFVRRTGATS